MPWPLWMVYGALSLLALLLVLACATGLTSGDDVRYARYAQALTAGEYQQAVDEWRRHNALRFGLIIPVAAVYAVFGVAEWTTMVVPIAASTLAVVLLVEVGRRLFGLGAGIIAGLLYATFPLRLIFGAVLIPELIAECYILLGVLCYLHARQRGGARWWAGAGLLMGAAYLTKEPALFIAGAVLLHAVWEREWRGAALFATGVASIGALEHAYYYLVWGDILFRVHITQPYAVASDDVAFFTPVKRNMGYFLLRKYPSMMLIPRLEFGLHSLACIVWAASALLLKPRRGYLLVVLWLVVPALYINFGTFSFRLYAPVPRVERYLEFLYPPLMLLSGVALSRAMGGGRSLARATSVMLGIVLMVGFASGLMVRGQIGRSEHMAILREYVREVKRTAGQTIYAADPEWDRAIRVFDASLLSPSRENATFIVTTGEAGMPALQRAAAPPDN